MTTIVSQILLLYLPIGTCKVYFEVMFNRIFRMNSLFARNNQSLSILWPVPWNIHWKSVPSESWKPQPSRAYCTPFGTYPLYPYISRVSKQVWKFPTFVSFSHQSQPRKYKTDQSQKFGFEWVKVVLKLVKHQFLKQPGNHWETEIDQ